MSIARHPPSKWSSSNCREGGGCSSFSPKLSSLSATIEKQFYNLRISSPEEMGHSFSNANERNCSRADICTQSLNIKFAPV